MITIFWGCADNKPIHRFPWGISFDEVSKIENGFIPKPLKQYQKSEFKKQKLAIYIKDVKIFDTPAQLILYFRDSQLVRHYYRFKSVNKSDIIRLCKNILKYTLSSSMNMENRGQFGQ